MVPNKKALFQQMLLACQNKLHVEVQKRTVKKLCRTMFIEVIHSYKKHKKVQFMKIATGLSNWLLLAY